jgi:phosphatidate cytidylyltransferase
MKREIVAALSLPALYFYIMKLPSVYFFLLLLIIVLIALTEFYNMYKVERGFTLSGVFFSTFFLYSVYSGIKETLLIIAISILVIISIRLLKIRKGPEKAMYDLAPVLLGFFYIPLTLSLLIYIRQYGPEWIIYTGATVWCSDSLAYYTGKNFGKRKLYPSVSPKKTVEGAFGSVAGGLTCSVLLSLIFIKKFATLEAVILGIIIGIIAIIGDLTESLFKRDSGVKDSSSLIPGHGGILDKLDGIIFATPIVYIFLITQ